jgi:hypothetical protein
MEQQTTRSADGCPATAFEAESAHEKKKRRKGLIPIWKSL